MNKEKVYYNSLNKYLYKLFGCKVYKISLNLGVTCPNRDGSLGTGGCIFCSKGGSGDFTPDSSLSIKEELESAKALIKNKLPKNTPCKYIAYFQAFTNTYGDPEYLKKKYEEAMEDEDVVALSIATRPDCLGPDILSVLNEINGKKKVFVELGLQTIHEKSAEYIRRGYKLSVYDKAVEDLKSIGIEVITHVILGLPGESKDDMLETVKYVSSKGPGGIKLQLLHILKNTDLATEYQEGRVKPLSFDEYREILTECVAALPDDIVVHRLTGDGKRSELLAPLWSLDKKRVLNGLAEYLSPRE